MLQLPKFDRNSKEAEGKCKCRPVCKSRRRQWKGKTQNTSAELLLDRKPQPLCFRRCPTKVFPNSPCPLFGRTRHVIINERDALAPPPNVVRVCQAPVDDHVETPYLRYVEIAKQNGAWDMVQACCAFCSCGPCCPCSVGSYMLHDEERSARRKSDMREFDSRVRSTYQEMRIMYDKP
ncbi:uncharacterized protein LOC106136345 [Amyelois transitella]|uniref:uncharacterized protein LOC106136345 n=1 Tax=Amyelois transitella TaxID=680683 RepID=UPI00298FB1F3|nr:uncharacterized protein LOC106136345 [Amyelois transitella]